ncbi:sce7726 family protein [Providencia rettgeri]|uniref:sce7726 family protein n=1 Tax=Providencia TaxID=586 RepID=UPI002275FCB1|nr:MULTISPECIES: sce7726 family protein [unclassified Providencia]MDB9566273.1 sce7726 family protein [Providencia rettgeri]WOB90511.1 sce7726 family protein [Providencia sp. PROV175]
MSYPSNQLRDLSSLFLRSEVSRWFKGDFKSIDVKLHRYQLYEKYKGKTYLSFVKKTYKLLLKHYPNEYVLKNEFLNQWLKKELGCNSSIIFNEFRIGNAIADLAMFNGVSKAFEIKSILDKDYRLSNQLQEYKKLFNEVYIIVPHEHLGRYIDFDNSIGVISYSNDCNAFNLERKPKVNQHVDIDTLMNVLHTKEYLKISKNYYKELPMMNSFNQFDICKELISSIENNQLNHLFIEAMKERKVNNLFFNKLNNELNQICLSLNLKKADREDLISKLKTNTV